MPVTEPEKFITITLAVNNAVMMPTQTHPSYNDHRRDHYITFIHIIYFSVYVGLVCECIYFTFAVLFCPWPQCYQSQGNQTDMAQASTTKGLEK